MRIHNKLQVLKVLNQHLISYPTPMNLNWNWSWGSLAGLLLSSQILTGILLAMHYTAHVDYAFASVQHLMTDVPSGIILRYGHANGASLFFVVVYLHILRGIYYSSGNQPREMVWITGVVILLLMIITAFIGYVLPWGQIGPKCLFYNDGVALATVLLNAPPKSKFKGDLGFAYLTFTCTMFSCAKRSALSDKDLVVLHNIEKEILDIMIGCLLGDVHAEKRGNTRLTFKQKLDDKDWVLWLHSVLSKKNYCSNVVLKPFVSGKKQTPEGEVVYYAIKFNTYTDERLNVLYNMFYVVVNSKKTKKLDSSLLHFLTPAAIAHWLADDGTRRNGNSAFCTDSFDQESIDLLRYIFKHKYGIDTIQYFHVNKYPRIQVSREHMPLFSSLIKPHLHSSMHYKLGDFI
jgi:ubiquinol-cytochrome c reductase cytochrome b subunit